MARAKSRDHHRSQAAVHVRKVMMIGVVVALVVIGAAAILITAAILGVQQWGELEANSHTAEERDSSEPPFPLATDANLTKRESTQRSDSDSDVSARILSLNPYVKFDINFIK
jgi:cytoskeletal protein RodZ